MNTPSERSHHPYSPSTLPSLEACPCYQSRQEEKLHERTVAGTKAHAVTNTGEDDNTLGDEDAAAAAECLDFVDQHRRLMEIAQKSDAGTGTILEIKEEYLPVDDLEFPECKSTTAGYVDHALIDYSRTWAKVFDWKFGLWPVEAAENNLQGLAYCLGMFKKFPTLKRVEFFFKQPHLGVVTSAQLRKEDIPAIYLRIQVVVAKARESRAAALRGDWSAAKPTVPVCNFCAHLGKCHKVSEFACKVGSKFHPLAIPENITPTMVHSSRDTLLGLQLASVMKVWAKAFKSQVTDRIIRSEADLPVGFELQQRSNREISDAQKYKEVALRHVTPEQYEAACSVTFGPIEDAIKEKAPRGSKQAAVESFNKELSDCGAVVTGEPYTFIRETPDKSKKTNKQ